MAELKTKPTAASVDAFLDGIADKTRRSDLRTISQIMEKATGAKPQMWGADIVGFGTYSYQGASTKSDWFVTGFANRKDALTLYLMGGLQQSSALLEKLGKHKTGKGCLYIKKLSDVDIDVLTKMVNNTVASLSAAEQGK